MIIVNMAEDLSSGKLSITEQPLILAATDPAGSNQPADGSAVNPPGGGGSGSTPAPSGGSGGTVPEGGGSSGGTNPAGDKPVTPPAPPAPSCPDNSNEAVRMNLSNAIVLRSDGRNFLQYLTITPTILQSLPYAYEVVNRTLLPGGTADQKKCYQLGNKNGRLYFATTLESSLYTEEFYHDAAVATADDQWTRIKRRFQKSTGLFREQAISAWLAFTFDSSNTIEKNIEYYKRLVFTLKESNAGIPSNVITSRLLTSLPSDFTAFKQAWSTRDEEDKQFESLIELIRAEAARRAIEGGVQDVTTLVTRFNRMRGLGRRVRRSRPTPQRNFQQTTRRTTSRRTVITCWSCGKPGHRSNECRSTQRQSQHTQMQQSSTAPRPQRRNRRGRPKPQANFAEVFMTEVSEPTTVNSVRLVIDSGSTHHCLADQSCFEELKTMVGSREIRFGNSSSLQASGFGPAVLIIRQGDRLVELRLKSALYVPEMNTSLLSVSQLITEGYRLGFTEDGITISSGRTKILAKKSNGLYSLDLKIPVKVNAVNSPDPDAVSLRACHEALAHVGINKVKDTLTSQGIPFIDDFDECDACLRGKQHKQPNRAKPENVRAHRPGRLWSDVCSATENSMTGKRHFLCIIDDHSRFRSVFFIQNKSEVPQCV